MSTKNFNKSKINISSYQIASRKFWLLTGCKIREGGNLADTRPVKDVLIWELKARSIPKKYQYSLTESSKTLIFTHTGSYVITI